MDLGRTQSVRQPGGTGASCRCDCGGGDAFGGDSRGTRCTRTKPVPLFRQDLSWHWQRKGLTGHPRIEQLRSFAIASGGGWGIVARHPRGALRMPKPGAMSSCVRFAIFISCASSAGPPIVTGGLGLAVGPASESESKSGVPGLGPGSLSSESLMTLRRGAMMLGGIVKTWGVRTRTILEVCVRRRKRKREQKSKKATREAPRRSGGRTPRSWEGDA